MAGGDADSYGDNKQDILFYAEFHYPSPRQMSSIFEI